jgi:hypothetical protein
VNPLGYNAMLTSRAARLAQATRIRTFHSSTPNKAKGYVVREGSAVMPACTHSLTVTLVSYTDSSITKIEYLTISACTNKTTGKGSGGRFVQLLRLFQAGFLELTRFISVAPKRLHSLPILYAGVRHSYRYSLRHMPYGVGKGFSHTKWAEPAY